MRNFAWFMIHNMLKRTLLTCLILCLATIAESQAQNRFTLVIDAGHGGHDAGALGSFSKEKNINLNVALAFGRYVERNCSDVKVVYTRKSDTFIPLHTRADIANKAKADLFISIHTNALPKGKISRGLETYTLGMARAGENLDIAKRENSVILVEKDYKERYHGFDPNSSESYIIFELMQDQYMQQSVELAKLVQKKVCAIANRPNKGVKQAGFLVLRETSMPSCLIELGFITTPDEERLLNSSNGIDAIARGIYQAFIEYKKKADPKSKVPYRSEEREPVSVPQVVPEQPKPQQVMAGTDDKAQGSNKDEPEQTSATKEPEGSEAASTESGDRQDDAPVFKVQIIASGVKLKANDPQFKGLTDVDSYQENGMTKYTVGASANYQEIYQLRKTLLVKFPQAFIIAFRGKEKMNVNEAIREYRSRKTARK